MLNVTIKQVRAFVTVARCRSFAEAADQLFLSQPALSVAIKGLEDALGGKLLVRSTRTLALSPEGEAFLPTAQRLLADWDTALKDVSSQFALRTGRVSLASMPSFAAGLLPEVLTPFKHQYPDVTITLQDVVAEEVIALVRSGRVELGICFDPGKQEDLQFFPLFEDRFVAVMPPNHPLLQSRKASIKQLASHGLITLQSPSHIGDLIRKAVEAEQVEFQPALEAHQLMTVGRMVATGLGVSIVPALCQPMMEMAGARCLMLQGKGISERVGIVTRRRYPLSAASQALFTFLQQRYLKQ